MVNYVFVEFLAGKNAVMVSNEQEYEYFCIFLEFLGILGMQEKAYEDWVRENKNSILYFQYGESIQLTIPRDFPIQVLELLSVRHLSLKENSIFPSMEQYRQTIQQRAASLINGI